jgi:hypothetical protein
MIILEQSYRKAVLTEFKCLYLVPVREEGEELLYTARKVLVLQQKGGVENIS